MIHVGEVVIIVAFIFISSGAPTFSMASGKESPNAALISSIIHRNDGSIMASPALMFLSTAHASDIKSL